jgi:hypothetical protein
MIIPVAAKIAFSSFALPLTRQPNFPRNELPIPAKYISERPEMTTQ